MVKVSPLAIFLAVASQSLAASLCTTSTTITQAPATRILTLEEQCASSIPTSTDKSIVYTSIYVTTLEEICPTGLRPHEYTVTELCSGLPTPFSNGHLPPGFTTTTVQCHVCASTPTPVILTVPCTLLPSAPGSNGGGQTPCSTGCDTTSSNNAASSVAGGQSAGPPALSSSLASLMGTSSTLGYPANSNFGTESPPGALPSNGSPQNGAGSPIAATTCRNGVCSTIGSNQGSPTAGPLRQSSSTAYAITSQSFLTTALVASSVVWLAWMMR